MRMLRDRSGLAGLEFALVAPVLVTLMIAATDFGAALLSRGQITQALANSAQYATLAGQANLLSTSAIATNARVYAGAVSNNFLDTATTTAVINNGAASGAKCCPGATWSCSSTSGFTCTDGSTPGVYITITASYPFKALFIADSYLVGKTLSDSVVAALR